MFLYVCLPIFYSTCCFVQSLYLFFNCCCLSWVRGRGASILYPKAAREPNQMIFISILRGHPLRKPMFFLSIHLFHCTFFSKYVSLLCLSIFRFFCCLSWYLPPIYLQSTYLYVYLRTFSSCKPSVLSIVSFNMSNIDIFVCSLFCLCLPKLFFLPCFFEFIGQSSFLSFACCM